MVIIWCDGSVGSFCGGNHETNTMCTFNLHTVICKWYVDKAGGKNQTRTLKKKKSFHCLDHLMKQFQNNLYSVPVEELLSFVLSHIWAITIFSSLAFKYNEASNKYALLVAQWIFSKESACQCRVGKIPWRRKWQPTPLFLPGESYGQRTLWLTAHGVAKTWTQLSYWTAIKYIKTTDIYCSFLFSILLLSIHCGCL